MDMVSQVPGESPIEVRDRALCSRRRWWLVLAVAFAGLAIGLTVVLVNLRTQLMARRSRLHQIALSQRVVLQWTDGLPFRHFYYRFFNRIPSAVTDYVQDIYRLETFDGDLDLPPQFFQDLAAFDGIQRISWLNPRYSAEAAQLLARQRNPQDIVFVTQKLKDQDFECISRFSDLRSLAVDGLQSPHLRGDFLQGAVGSTTQLSGLTLLHMKLSPEACQSIGRLKSLEVLQLTGCSLTSELAGSLRGLPRLRYLGPQRNGS